MTSTEVIKIEPPDHGDSLRQFGTATDCGDTLVWLSESRNKKCVTLNLRTPRGLELLRDLVARSDVLVENFRAGVMEKWGLGWEAVHALNPRVIMVRISAYGQTGPYRSRPGFARVAHAFSGLAYLAGEPDRVPVVPGSTSLADYMSGVYGAFGALAALQARDTSRRPMRRRWPVRARIPCARRDRSRLSQIWDRTRADGCRYG